MLHAFEHAFDAAVQRTVNSVEQQLRVAEDRIERCPQFVAHVGEKLHLVLTRDLDLPALFLDLLEQADIFKCDRRLIAESLQQRNLPLVERAYIRPPQNSAADPP